MSQVDQLLRDHSLNFDAEGLRALLKGVLSAPKGEHPERWMELVASERSAELTDALHRALAELAATNEDGLDTAPAPADRLDALRAELARCGVDGFLVPRGDEFHNEYPPRRADRLEWLTGFSGSAGLAAVLPDQATMLTDGRYTLQAKEQVDGQRFLLRHIQDEPVDEWLVEHLAEGQRFAIDPWLHTGEELNSIRRACAAKGAELVRLDRNPIDAVWDNQPEAPVAPLRVHPLEYAGVTIDAKREQVVRVVARAGADAAVITATDSVAWLFNLRGGDLPHTPAFLGYAIVTEAASTLFVDERKLTDTVRSHLSGVTVKGLGAFAESVSSLGGRVIVDESTTPVAVVDLLGSPLFARDPVALPKAAKNSTELKGSRAAHRRDGAAVTQFLHWLEGAAAAGRLGELEASAKLLEFRRRNELFEDLSFETITGAGPNGAVIHYRATKKSERILERNSIYLIDSGAQYLDGTTDITRTVVVGEPTAEQKDRFTRVLKGHIAMAQVVFPKGTTGSQIDVLARMALWEVGLDYDHGTGHGVGSYLGVHEGPQRIANRPNTVPLEPGMICSNEPGYYKPGAYGIRIENLVVVTAAPEIVGAEREMYGFETLTLAPIERRLIEASLLTAGERRWLNAYHARVCEQLAPLVDHDTAKWLREVTVEI